ncbi:MAG: sulfatase-like hydrolase/transferase [Planctomycetes bacterium]|nr:sulfatase-like hydrolase/transferase [Planctomycetota bacterium]
MKRPNILLIYTDQQRWDTTRTAGNADMHTPNLDALAEEGLYFRNCYVQNPVCMPSRISMLSGRYPSTLRIFDNGVPVPEDTAVLPHMLRNYGYVSGQIGKLHFQNHANRDHRNVHPAYGFDHLEISDEPGCYEDSYHAWVKARAPEAVDLISCGLPSAAEKWYGAVSFEDRVRHPEGRYSNRPEAFKADEALTHSAFVAEQTMEFIRRHREGPFLCVAGFYAPHFPWFTPQRFLDLYEPGSLSIPSFPEGVEYPQAKGVVTEEDLRGAHQGYYAMVSEVDHHVGRLLECLQREGAAENTLVVFTSDHGERLGQQMTFGKGQPGFDCDTHVPLIMRWPAGIGNRGGEVSGIVEAVDIVPTLLEAAGVPVPPACEGQAVDIRGGSPGSDRRSALIEMHTCKSVRTGRYRYTLYRDGRETLFDYERDHAEYFDVSGEAAYAGELSELRRELAFRQMAGESFRPRTWSY